MILHDSVVFHTRSFISRNLLYCIVPSGRETREKRVRSEERFVLLLKAVNVFLLSINAELGSSAQDWVHE